MTKLQASMKDASAKKWRERKLYYRVGGCCKGCQNCGVIDPSRERTVWSEVLLRKVKVQHYTSGYNVFRSFAPKAIGWTFKCFDCHATDVQCWGGTYDMGEEPRILPGSDLGAESRKEKGSGNPRIIYKRERMEGHSPEGKDSGEQGTKARPVLMKGERVPHKRVLDDKETQILALQRRIAELAEMLK